MPWNVVVFETERKEKPVEKFIKSLDKRTTAKVIHHIDLLQQYGNKLGAPHSKKLVGKLLELRIRGKQEVRIIYAFKKKTIYLLHAFTKKSQKTPKKEIEKAGKRLDIW